MTLIADDFFDGKRTLSTSEIRARALAVLVGVALFFFEAAVPALLLGDSSPLLVPIDVAVYGVSGVVFGFVWPDGGWRLGLYLFAIWPPMLLFMLFLSIEQPSDWKREARNLFGYLLILIAACIGAQIGTLIRRRRMVESSHRT
ncbi:MAG: hypothetical protein ACR2HX_15185 [Pyrinomonadaceae bacterium]